MPVPKACDDAQETGAMVLTEDQRALQETARRFARERLLKHPL